MARRTQQDITEALTRWQFGLIRAAFLALPIGLFVASEVIGTTPTAAHTSRNNNTPLTILQSSTTSSSTTATLPKTAPTAALVTVSDEAGKDPPTAANDLVALGLRVTALHNESSDGISAGIVIRTEPGTGTQVASGSSVVLVVSSGPPSIVVPNVTGMTQNSAMQSLQSAGFTVTTVNQPSSSVNDGLVITQTPPAGTTLRKGSNVTLTVGAATTIPATTSTT